MDTPCAVVRLVNDEVDQKTYDGACFIGCRVYCNIRYIFPEVACACIQGEVKA